MDLLRQLPPDMKAHVSSVCIDGTSSTALLVDSRRGDILAPTKIYNEDQGEEAVKAIKVWPDSICRVSVEVESSSPHCDVQYPQRLTHSFCKSCSRDGTTNQTGNLTVSVRSKSTRFIQA